MADLQRPKRHFVTLREGAAIVSDEYFPISARTLERWPLAIRVINRKRLADITEIRRLAQAEIDAAPAIHRDRRRIGARLRSVS